ncbi:MAG: SCO family protein [Phycisphaeraceae bacterium]|jgi:protein SCO1/2|nr:SCO family protein [Phycisphaeraceae bacterium]
MNGSAVRRSLIVVLGIALFATLAIVKIQHARESLAERESDNTRGQLPTGFRDADGTANASSAAMLFDQPLALPAFTLTDQHGQPFGTDDLRGSVWVANFVFSHCPGMCPRMTSRLSTLQVELEQHPAWRDIRLVSITVDPDRDTPARLTKYAEMAQADARHWRFLTGSRATLWSLIKDGFKLPVVETDDPAQPIIHSQKFVLVDRQGRVRGYYDALDTLAEDGHIVRKHELERLKADVDRLVAGK